MIKIIAGGKPHKNWLAEGVNEYEKRLFGRFQTKWLFLSEEKLNQLLESGVFKAQDYVILLDEHGENLDSMEFCDKLERVWNSGLNLVIVIGGPYGFSAEAKKAANLVWSLGKEVLPHELARLVVTEQIYRAQEISRGSSYHHV